MKDTEKAYIAGIFDGEGSIANTPYRATKNGKKYNRIVLRIYNTHKETLDWIVSVVGFGNIVQEKRTNRLGKKDLFVLVITNKKAVELLKGLRPFLKIKATKVDEILSGPVNGPVL